MEILSRVIVVVFVDYSSSTIERWKWGLRWNDNAVVVIVLVIIISLFQFLLVKLAFVIVADVVNIL